MRARIQLVVVLGLVALVAACGGGAAPPDAAGTDSMLPTCTTDADCDDHMFCDGAETCMPTAPTANARGCVSTPSCMDSQRCDEAMRRCVTSCVVDADADHDGFDAVSCGGADCDDTDPHRFPTNPEVCDPNAHDEDCDPTTFGDLDADGDGYASGACCNGGTGTTMNCGPDCNDRRLDAHPGATEACEGIDNDCDTAIDEGLLVPSYPDLDFDLHGATGTSTLVCPGTPGFSTVDDDCDDTNPARFGAQLEICDGIDNNCNGMIDEAPASIPWYPDADGDLFGAIPTDPSQVIVSCSPVAGHSSRASDCDDGDAQIHPGAREICNGLDDDCNGRADAAGTGPGDTEDDDADGFADVVCGGNDCDDALASRHPHASELCNGIDDDCDGVVDGASAMAEWYLDLDHDGFGDMGSPPIMSCDPQPGRVALGGDCDDANAAIHPRAPDPCDGVDSDCDTQIDETGIRFAFFPDADGDHYGTTDASALVFRCTAPAGTVAVTGDCADTNAMVFPGAPEQCNASDDDCDTTIDEDSMHDWFVDVDHDGHGTGAAITACMAPAGRVAVGDDCNDGDASVFPSATEQCNGRDDDCDGTADDGASASCGGRAHSTGTCTAGLCSLSCSTGYADCDGIASTGCEIDTDHAASFCGSCTTICHPGDTCGGATLGACDRSPVIALSGTDTYVLALRQSGGVAAWGDGTNAASTFGVDLAAPTATSLTGLLDLDTSTVGHGCALTAAHTVLCWGANANGQLGDGAVAAHGPALVAGLSNVVSVSAGGTHSCAALMDGTVWCWGYNQSGQLGDNTFSQRVLPTRTLNISDAVEVSCGANFSCARRGTPGAYYVTCWGSNIGGELGIGTTGGTVPMVGANVLGIPPDVVAFGEQANSSTCVRTGDGRALCWGANNLNYSLGLGATSPAPLPSATQVPGLAGVILVTLGVSSGCAIVRGATANELWCWGTQSLGNSWINGTTTAAYTPVRMTAFVDPVAVAVGSYHACAALRDGSVLCVGNDNRGQLGDGGGFTNSTTAVPALLLP